MAADNAGWASRSSEIATSQVKSGGDVDRSGGRSVAAIAGDGDPAVTAQTSRHPGISAVADRRHTLQSTLAQRSRRSNRTNLLTLTRVHRLICSPLTGMTRGDSSPRPGIGSALHFSRRSLPILTAALLAGA